MFTDNDLGGTIARGKYRARKFDVIYERLKLGPANPEVVDVLGNLDFRFSIQMKIWERENWTRRRDRDGKWNMNSSGFNSVRHLSRLVD